MTAAYFEDHPTDPDKVILRKPRLDQGPDYERGFIDGMKYQMQSSVDKAINAMSQLDPISNKIRNDALEEVAKEVDNFKAFEKDTMASFAAHIRSMKGA